MLAKITLTPGINRDTTSYTNTGGWFDSDYIRFRNGLPEKIGGWTKVYANQAALIGTCRKLYDWSSLVGTKYLACPTSVKFYVDNTSGIIDITPLRRSVTLGSDPIATATSSNATASFTGSIENSTLLVTAVSSGTVLVDSVISGVGVTSGTRIVEYLTGTGGVGTYKLDTPYATPLDSTSMSASTTVLTITDVNHGASPGDYVVIAGSTDVNSVSATQINREFCIVAVANANAYSVTVSGAATASGSGGGSSVTAKYQFHPGISTAVEYAGWGSGPWGGIFGSYGWGYGPNTTVVSYYSGLWTVDNYGEDMIACPRDVTNGYKLTDSNPIATSNTSNVVTVTQTNHGFSNGTAIIIGGITSEIGEIPASQLNGTHTITVANANAYTFTVSNAATSTTSGGTDAYVYISSIIYWDIGDTTGPAKSLSNLGSAYAKKYLPYVAKEVMVSDQNRQVIAYGCNPFDVSQKQDPMVIRWSDSSDPTNWDAADTTSNSGERRLSSGSYIVTAVQNREEILVWTDNSLFSMTYVGQPDGYGFNLVGNNFDIIGPNAKIVTGAVAYWMGSNNFYSYNGKVEPLPCTVRDYVFLDLSVQDGDKVYCSADSGNNEIIWFYPSKSQGGNPGFREVDRYVVYNYGENSWYYGSMARTAWIDRQGHAVPRAVDPEGYLFNQETGFDDGSTTPASPINAYIQSSPIEIEDGNNYLFINRVIPDLTFRNSTTHDGDYQPNVKFTIKPQDYPGAEIGAGDERDVARSSAATLNVNRFTNQVFTRLRARSVALRVESDVTGISWRLGTPRFDMRKDGRK